MPRRKSMPKHPSTREIPSRLFPNGFIALAKVLHDAAGPHVRLIAEGKSACPVCVLFEMEPLFNLKLHHKFGNTVGGDDLFTEMAFVIISELARPHLIKQISITEQVVDAIIAEVVPLALTIKPLRKRINKTKATTLIEVAVGSYVDWLKAGRPVADETFQPTQTAH